MTALLVQTSATVPAWWFVLLCAVAVGLIPVTEWIGRTPSRRRVVAMLGIAIGLGCVMAYAIEPPPGQWADCCDWLVPYGICWPIWWGC